MGGATFVLDGRTLSEVEQKIEAKLEECRLIPLYEEKRALDWDADSQKYIVYLRVHT
jgi:hypothetical protein